MLAAAARQCRPPTLMGPWNSLGAGPCDLTDASSRSGMTTPALVASAGTEEAATGHPGLAGGADYGTGGAKQAPSLARHPAGPTCCDPGRRWRRYNQGVQYEGRRARQSYAGAAKRRVISSTTERTVRPAEWTAGSGPPFTGRCQAFNACRGTAGRLAQHFQRSAWAGGRPVRKSSGNKLRRA